jgi:hypothetical protein
VAVGAGRSDFENHSGGPDPTHSDSELGVHPGRLGRAWLGSSVLSEPSGYFGFPEAGGSSFERGLNGAADKLVLETEGSVTFAKPAHCIMEVEVADLVVTLDGASSSIELDSVYDIDTPPGCTDEPAVPTSDVTFARLDLSGVTPAYSNGGKTVTWSAIPATLTAEGSAAFGLPNYKAGQVLDPVTVTVGLE